MTNNDFETQHPRGHAKNKGSFIEKTNTAPEGTLTVGTPIKLTRLDQLETITAVSLGQDANGPIKCVDVRLNDFHDGVIGKPYTLLIEPIADLNLTGLQPDGMTDAQWLQKLDDHHPVVDAFLEARYGAYVDFPDVDEGDSNGWDGLELHFRLDIPARDITREEAFDIGWNQTKAVQAYNESDHGTSGTENLGRLLNEAMDNAVVLTTRYDIVRAAELRGRHDIDSEVELRAGERELRDVTALAIAQEFGRKTPESRALTHLGRHGWGNKTEIHDELLAIYQRGDSPRDRRRANMMFTWLIHGGDNS